jgi:CheY-like chemotaxis protein
VDQKRILIVDDEPSIRIIVSAIFEREGYIVDTAEDGFVALRKIQQVTPDLVISDLRMPNMNGFELLSVLRTRYPGMPTIAISGEFLSREVDDALIADAFFQKGSYSIQDMLATVADLLSAPIATARGKSRVGSRGLSPMWTPTGNSPVMLTCTHCLRSFPIELCDGGTPSKEIDCVFCGERLSVEVLAIGTSAQHG